MFLWLQRPGGSACVVALDRVASITLEPASVEDVSSFDPAWFPRLVLRGEGLVLGEVRVGDEWALTRVSRSAGEFGRGYVTEGSDLNSLLGIFGRQIAGAG